MSMRKEMFLFLRIEQVAGDRVNRINLTKEGMWSDSFSVPAIGIGQSTRISILII